MEQIKYRVIGQMSGTSMDGLDLAICSFEKQGARWKYEIEDAITYPYTAEWQEKLSNAGKLDAFGITSVHKDYGRYIGIRVNEFLKGKKHNIDFIASHGHTIFHQPAKHLTLQIGDGAFIAAETGITTISDFRNLDVALGGQGAPLVPIGDELLFPDYDFCLNLGGFANISYNKEGKRIAFDICPVNIVLNHLAKSIGMDFDKDGAQGRSGTINEILLKRLNELDFYAVPPPKSLGREWLETLFLPLVNAADIPISDKFSTLYEHIALQISTIINAAGKNQGKVLATGGGAFNTLLTELIQQKIQLQLVIPDPKLVNFKEALVFAFLGVLRFRNEINCLASVTGASKNSSSGVIHLI